MGASGTDLRAFVADLRRRMQPMRPTTPLPKVPATTLREVVPDADFVARFRGSAEAAGCRVSVTNARDWAATACDILVAEKVQRLVIEPQPGTALTPERAEELESALAGRGIVATRDRDDATLFATDAGMTGVRAAVAETGTLVCASSPAAARGTSLIPPIHVALVAADQLVADLFDLFEQLAREGELPANINLISGPSKTADIEGVLVTGVHGPGVAHVVLIA